MGWKAPALRERLTMLVIVGMSTEEHFLRSQVGIRSESDHLLGESNRILYTLHSDAGLKVEKIGGVDGGKGVLWRHSCRNAV